MILAVAAAALALAAPVNMQQSVGMTHALRTETLCVKDHDWRSFLRQHGSTDDAPSMSFFIFGNGEELVELAFPGTTCDSLLRPWLSEDWEVSIALYSVATELDQTGAECGVTRIFYKLRKTFRIRRSVTVSDFIPEPRC